MKILRISIPSYHAGGGFDPLNFALVVPGKTFSQAMAAAQVLDMKVEEVDGPLFTGSIVDGDGEKGFQNVTLDQLFGLAGLSEEDFRANLATLPDASCAQWEAVLSGTSKEYLESESLEICPNSLHIRCTASI
jgi:hypothetical protein